MFKQDVLSAQERMVLGLRELYEGYGYTRFPMRRVEESSLYLENKSFLTSERVLSFTNANGKLMALKPDVTLSIVKRAHAERSGVEKLYYNESVYRVSPTDHEVTEIEPIGVEYRTCWRYTGRRTTRRRCWPLWQGFAARACACWPRRKNLPACGLAEGCALPARGLRR